MNHRIIEKSRITKVLQYMLKCGISHRYAYRNIYKLSTEGKEFTCKIYTGEGNFFKLRKSDAKYTMIIYYWESEEAIRDSLFILTATEALEFLGDSPQQTDSWIRQGYYKWSSASGLPKQRRTTFVELFGNRIDWLKAQLQH
jgi:hypothetical protein